MDLQQFREACRQNGLPLTRQREAIYEAIIESTGHPDLDAVFERSRAKDPSLSLATVYNNVRRFLELGLINEVNPVHGGMRIEANPQPHHHLICTTCHSVSDITPEQLGTLRIKRNLPNQFSVQRVCVDVLGTCAACKTIHSHSSRSTQKQ